MKMIEGNEEYIIRIKRQLADSTWVIDEAVETKKVPYKTSSNFCGPIIPNKN